MMKILKLSIKELSFLLSLVKDAKAQISQNPHLLQKDALVSLANSLLIKLNCQEVNFAGFDVDGELIHETKESSSEVLAEIKQTENV